MRKLTLLFVLILAGFLAQAQYYYVPFINAGGNPGGLNTDAEYPVGGGIPAGWTVVLGPSNTSPNWSAVQTLPFSFEFNGSPFTQYKVSSSGVLTFSTTTALAAPAYANAALPSALIPDHSVMVWGVAGTGSNDNIVTKTFGTSPNRQCWVSFTSYTGEVGASGWQYWSIVLEETTNKIYMVDQRFYGTNPSLTVGVQVNGTDAYSVSGSPSVGCNAGNNALPDDNTYYEFNYGSQVQYDLWGKVLDLYPIQALASAPFTLEGTLVNLGSEVVTGFDLNYSIDGGAAVTSNVTGVSINTYANYAFSHPQTWNPATVGTYTLKVWASNINGNPDQNNANDTLTKVITVVPEIVQRLPLHEAFTSSTCGPCVLGNTNLTAVFDDNPNKWTCLKYQMSWPSNGDPYYTAEGGDRRTFYSVNSVPNLWVDGGLGINTQGYTDAQLNAAYDNPSFVHLTATSNINPGSKSVTIDVTIDPVADISSTDLVLHTAIFEYLTHNNAEPSSQGGNGETDFHFVMKKMVPDAFGTSLSPLVSGTPVNESLSYTFNGNYRLPNSAQDPINHAIEHSVEEFSDLGVIVWIQDVTTKEVFQSAYATITVGTSEPGDPNGIVGLFPNPASSQANLHYYMQQDGKVTVDVYNVMGQRVISLDKGVVATGSAILQMNTADLPAGVYVVHATINGKTFTTKMNVTH